MRKVINALWLDDNNDDGVLKMQSVFESVLNNSGYKANIICVNNYDEADTLMLDKSKRIDFFVSDFNLEDDKSGIDFLIKIRKNGRVKEHFVLYSNNSKDAIRKSIKELVNQDIANIDYLSNYYFFSTSHSFDNAFLIKEFSESVKIALNRWNELTALRGQYASINTLLEWITRKILSRIGHGEYIRSGNNFTYDNCISKLRDLIYDGTLIYTLSSAKINNCINTWYECKKYRNVLEHNVERWDSSRFDFVICDQNSTNEFLESKVSDYRKELLKQVIDIKELIDDLLLNNGSLSGVENEQEYIDLSDGL